MWSRVSLLIAWGLLVGVVAWSAAQTQALVQTVDADVLVTSERICGSWLGTYQMLNVWAAETLEPKAATEVRVRFAADFKQHCPDYRQAFP